LPEKKKIKTARPTGQRPLAKKSIKAEEPEAKIPLSMYRISNIDIN
jgi:hypothetical protein